jgi:hypothetical protein
VVKDINWYCYGNKEDLLNAFQKLSDFFIKNMKMKRRNDERKFMKVKYHRWEGSDFYARNVNKIIYRGWYENAHEVRAEARKEMHKITDIVSNNLK